MPHFALIDAARDPKIYPMLQGEKQVQSLFGGRIDPHMQDVVPYILRLDPASPFRRALEEYGWVNHWGITCYAPAKMVNVRRELRKNMQARLPDSQVALFRFYDPRVWVPFITSSSGAELNPWFDLIESYWAPHPKTGATMKFTCEDGALIAQAA
ncbi:DUF4123 domain-containing protein [Actibacterium sp. 188UL27-1]|uniref:DUF4123 domain-containing protein n=1 Tax=Actibacterium sp. 188UL27-1 TaxID=2786961 RepID=UPI00195A533D|nr:DUF4123 domain-containing protein [Actibacterium sp. 188UL27-1]MBM7066854.1 DUF4123 domain-containing protein [Actibacterium sp. 188UL27-1]